MPGAPTIFRHYVEGLSGRFVKEHTYEEIIAGSANRPGWGHLLDNTDILADGPFVKEKRNILLWFRGSENQRLIDRKTNG